MTKTNKQQEKRRGITPRLTPNTPHVPKNPYGKTSYLLGSYDATYIPENVVDAGKAAYVERNYHMIDKADLCIFYYDENYKPPLKPATRGRITRDQPKSGTKIAYEYAIRQQKEIINLSANH